MPHAGARLSLGSDMRPGGYSSWPGNCLALRVTPETGPCLDTPGGLAGPASGSSRPITAITARMALAELGLAQTQVTAKVTCKREESATRFRYDITLDPALGELQAKALAEQLV